MQGILKIDIIDNNDNVYIGECVNVESMTVMVKGYGKFRAIAKPAEEKGPHCR